MRFRIPCALGLLLLLPALLRADDGPKIADERVVLHTIAGDVVLAFYPEVAPQHVKQILHLVELGVYDHTYFFRVEPGFVLQLADARMGENLTPRQQEAIHPIRAEFSSQLHHRRGILSMARADGLPDSATTSFSIVLGEAGHLDKQYTIFGEVIYGMDAVDKLVRVPPLFIDPKSQPLPMVPLLIDMAEVVAAKDLDVTKLTKAHDVQIASATIEKAHRDAWEFHRAYKAPESSAFSFTDVNKAYLMSGGLLMVVVLSLAAFFGAGRMTQRWLISLNMLIVLIAGFLLMVLLTPFAQQDKMGVIGLIVFISFFGIFKLLSRFESVG